MIKGSFLELGFVIEKALYLLPYIHTYIHYTTLHYNNNPNIHTTHSVFLPTRLFTYSHFYTHASTHSEFFFFFLSFFSLFSLFFDPSTSPPVSSSPFRRHKYAHGLYIQHVRYHPFQEEKARR